MCRPTAFGKVPGIFRIVCLSCLLPAPGWGIEFTEFRIDESTLTLTIWDDGSSSRFELEENLGLDEGEWRASEEVTLVPIGGNRYRFTMPRGDAERRLFRIIGSFLGSELDPDGDGLPTTLEEGLSADSSSPQFSDPNLLDTDGDGFSDGVEYAMGTEPNNPDSFPDQAALPAVEFAASQSEAIEGGASHRIDVVGTEGFTGTVYYSVNPRGTANAPEDFETVSGSLSLVGGAGSIELDWVDDRELSPQRLVMIDLSTDPPGNAYRAAGRVTHVVTLNDNDNYWSGVLRDEVGERNFRVRLTHDASGAQLAFVSGMSDGLPVVDGGTSSQSTGVIPAVNLAGEPQEVFPATGVVHVDSRFSAISPELPVDSSGIFGEVALKRVLEVDANPSGDAAHNLTPNVIIGGFTERIRHATDPAISYLDADLSGVFVLSRDLPGSPEIESALRPE